MDQQDKIKVSIIVSVYNEQEVLKGFWEELYAVLSVNERYSWNVIFVNDGSKDESQNIINSILENSIGPVNVQSLEFSRNFGHEAAMIAGIDSTEDDAVICLDADLQHPPSKIQAMLDEYEKGEDVVLMKRLKRHDNGLVKNFFSNFF